MSTNLMIDLLGPPVLVLVFALLAWASDRAITGGRPLTPHMRNTLLYGSVFLLGGSYSMALASAFHWGNGPMFSLIAGWGIAVIVFAVWRYRRRVSSALKSAKSPPRTKLSHGLPVVGVLVSLVMSAIEWEFVAEGQGHLWQALAWTAALAASIWLARQNRRAAVVMALRVFLVLGVIGAIGHPSVTLVVALGVVAIVYFLIERLWPNNPEPPVLDFETLSRNKPD
jgi:hypothetical protein